MNFDGHMDEAIERGRENARVIELAQNHCQLMEFPVAAGHGMLEDLVGLPINMRRIRCPKAIGNSAAPRLRSVARSFYTEHCVGCALRKPSGGLPTLASLVQADEREEAESERLAAEREEEVTRSREERAKRRRPLRVASDPAMAAVLRDLDILDGGTTGVEATRAAAMKRLNALAKKAPKSFTNDVLQEMLDLVPLGQHELLGPLRLVCRDREAWRKRSVDAALALLNNRPSDDAARVLVQFPELAAPRQFSASVVRSLLYVAYGPYDSDLGFSQANSTTDPATLRLLVDKAGGTLSTLLETMLPGPRERSALVLLEGARKDEPPAGEARPEFDRATAAAAVGQLLTTGDPLAERFVPALVRNLLVDGDEYDTHPHSAVQQALALFILFREGGAEDAWWAAGKSASDDQRQLLFKVWWQLSRLTDPGRGWEASSPNLSVEPRDELRTRVFDTSMRLIDGQWGYNVAGEAADVISNLAGDNPDWAASRTDAMLGGFLAALTASEEPRPKVLLSNDDTPDFLSNVEWESRASILRSAASRFLDATQQAARADPVRVVTAVLTFLEHERDTERGLGVSWRLIPLLGEIGRDVGERPGVLRLIVPAMYTYLMSASPALVSRAVQAWADVGSRNPLPSLFQDLLPLLLDSGSSGVIVALLESLPRLQLSEAARREALRYALNWMFSSEPSGRNERLFRPAIECAGRLIQQLPDAHFDVERILLSKTAQLAWHDVGEVLRVRWSAAARQSVEYAQIRLARVIDPRANPSFSRRDNEEEVALLRCARGLLGLTLPELQHAALSFGPERIILGLEIVEVAWRAGRVDDALAICDALGESVPEVPAFERQRGLMAVVGGALRGLPGPPIDEEPFDENGFPSPLFHLAEQARSRLSLRELLRETPMTASNFSASAAMLQREATTISNAAQRDTPTAAYVRLFAELCQIAASIYFLEAADLEGQASSARAHRRAFKRRLAALSEELTVAFEGTDPLGGPLAAAVEFLRDDADGDPLALVASWASLTVPLILIDGAALEERVPGREETVEEPEEDVAVSMIFIDERLLTGTAVLAPDTVYTLGVELQVDEWPEWADRLDLEMVGGLSPSEIQLPTMTWRKPPDFDGTLRGEGTLVLRFSLPSGRPAQPFAVVVSWSGASDGRVRSERLDIAGHREIRLRPFDSTRDALTTFDVVDEQLLELYSSLSATEYPDEEIQAFCRLFTAVCRAGFTYTWDKKYRRGTRVTEKQFHDDLYADLLADSDLEGRVNRGSPLALGYLDIRHDRITAELKVERFVAVTKESAPKYMRQATQYAAADGRHISILAILDMSPKELPVGTPENYLFTLVPALHGLKNPEAPSLVAVVVVNGNMPSPSSWSRRKKPRPA